LQHTYAKRFNGWVILLYIISAHVVAPLQIEVHLVVMSRITQRVDESNRKAALYVVVSNTMDAKHQHDNDIDDYTGDDKEKEIPRNHMHWCMRWAQRRSSILILKLGRVQTSQNTKEKRKLLLL
jgi:hypothetical protein